MTSNSETIFELNVSEITKNELIKVLQKLTNFKKVQFSAEYGSKEGIPVTFVTCNKF